MADTQGTRRDGKGCAAGLLGSWVGATPEATLNLGGASSWAETHELNVSKDVRQKKEPTTAPCCAHSLRQPLFQVGSKQAKRDHTHFGNASLLLRLVAPHEAT